MSNIWNTILVVGIGFGIGGCTFSRFLITEELMLARGAGLRATATRIAITEEALAMKNIARLKVKPGTVNSPVLYLPEAGMDKPLFELLNQNTIKRISTGEIFPLPFRIFRVNGLARAEVRSGPGSSYKLYKTIPKDRFVLVRDEVSGWYKIQLDDLIGWVSILALSPAVKDESSSGIIYTPIVCHYCDGQAIQRCVDCTESGIENCVACCGKGKYRCTNCSGSGHVSCLVCKGKEKNGCPSCKGVGYLDCGACKMKGYFECRICRATGKIPCAVCDGTLHTKCYYCFGTAVIIDSSTKENYP